MKAAEIELPEKKRHDSKLPTHSIGEKMGEIVHVLGASGEVRMHTLTSTASVPRQGHEPAMIESLKPKEGSPQRECVCVCECTHCEQNHRQEKMENFAFHGTRV